MNRTLLVGLVAFAIAAAAFGGWWLQDVRVEASWNPDWPSALRVTGDAVEKIVSASGSEVTEGDRARAAERARWKAYYYAQLRVAEQLGDLEIAAATSIHEFTEIDQELRASFTGAIRAAAEVDSSTELLDDAVAAKVTVEVPSESMHSLREVIAAALRTGRISIERRPRPVAPKAPEEDLAPVRVAEEEVPEDTTGRVEETDRDSGSPEPPESDVQIAEARSIEKRPMEKRPKRPTETRPAETRPTETRPTEKRRTEKQRMEKQPADEPMTEAVETIAEVPVRRPAPALPAHTGAAVRLGENPARLGVTSVLYELGGAEIGTVLDLPPERLTAGFFPIADATDEVAVERLAGSEPRRLEATISGRDLFLTERLSAEEIRQVRQWLRAGQVVLILG